MIDVTAQTTTLVAVVGSVVAAVFLVMVILNKIRNSLIRRLVD